MAIGALALVVTFTPVVQWGAQGLSSPWRDGQGDVLVLLTGSESSNPGYPSGMVVGTNTYWRVLHAIYMWRAGSFRTLVVCGVGSEVAVKPLLLAYGIPGAAIVTENRSTSTHENALFVKPILAGLSGRFVLVTSDYHTYRASRCFARAGIPVVMQAAPDVLMRSNSLVYRWQGFWTLMTEYAKIGYYRIRGWI